MALFSTYQSTDLPLLSTLYEPPPKHLISVLGGDAGDVDITTVAAVGATISKMLFGKYWLAVNFKSATFLQITL
jgi:hypothetical protein